MITGIDPLQFDCWAQAMRNPQARSHQEPGSSAASAGHIPQEWRMLHNEDVKTLDRPNPE
jgi:hypothetical protein